ncbi:MAG: response regulator [Methanoregula sp.]|nr:response regulator [Methanoregula sp.]
MSLTDTILIVDDSSFIVEGLVAILKKNYRPLAAYGGQQCLEILKKEKPSIIILDVLMEPMDGWETLARIKENPATLHIPVLMFSAKKISAEEAEEHRINIDDFVSKPVTTKKLIEAIEKVLARQEANRLSIESWQSAGIGQDRIDEYTSLMTNLEVDMSLLQNMKVQLSLVCDDDNKSRMDFESVIAAIESRIQEERLHEEELSSEMQKSVARHAEVKERAGPVPAMNESGQESLPAEGGAKAAAQPEPLVFLSIADGETNPSATEVLIPEVSVSHEVTVPEITTISEVRLPDSGVIPETTGSFSLFEGGGSWESSQENPEMKAPAESPAGEPGHDPVLSGPSIPKEITEMHPATLLPPTETSTGNYGSGVNVSSDKKAPVAEQKSPPRRMPPPSAKTPGKKSAAPNAPIPGAIGSGTDTSLRMSPSSAGRSWGTAKDNPFVPVKDVAVPSVGFFSRIISMIIGIFKRK